ncbi:hypothetical protein [Pseudarthrobacter sp. NCCP-2145]|uniref:hypothetical protein n=1 Tax=Pseudarthrobacter sp. NCCP-2145 TaxID=2942290 RepID=UPI00203CF5A6|nr:hypothetical protein [Pseudarthrobacter sp. NCCP-2145]GKV74459.1 hypothetical protein NCCP2145_38400 [Pseudarthrobacter sp. NCCP-2145]
MNQSGFQALKLLTEAGRLWNVWRSLDDSSKQALKVEGVELKEAVYDARRASLAAIERTRTSLKQKGLSKRRARALDQSPSSLRFQNILEALRQKPNKLWSAEEVCEAVVGNPKNLQVSLSLLNLGIHGIVVREGKEYKYKTQEDWFAAFPHALDDRLHEAFLQEYVEACMSGGFATIPAKGLPSQKSLGLEDELLEAVVGAALEQGFREGVLFFYDLQGFSGQKILVGLPPESLEGFESTIGETEKDAPSVVEAASRLARASQELLSHLRELQGSKGPGYGKTMTETWSKPQGDLDWSAGSNSWQALDPSDLERPSGSDPSPEPWKP